jgi:hypothetical protein
MPDVSTTARIYGAGVVLGTTVSAAVWLFTYRTWSVIEYIDRPVGISTHPSASGCNRGGACPQRLLS